MPGATFDQGWPYPLPGEVLTRQKCVDLVDAMHFSLGATDTSRTAALQRTRGLLGNSGSVVFTVGVASYMTWNVDHLDNWSAGGRAITSTQGPTLSSGLYVFTVHMQQTSSSHSAATYTSTDFGFERGGTMVVRRRLFASQPTWRISAPVVIPVGSPQQVKVRVITGSGTGGATMTVARSNAEASPRLSWVQIAAAA